MNDPDLQYLCTAIGNLSGIPIRLYEGNEPVFFYYAARLARDPASLFREEMWKIPGTVGYYMTDTLDYYGIVRYRDFRIVIGPSRQVPNTDRELQQLAFRLDVPQEEKPAFFAAMKGILRMPFESILQMLCTVNYSLNGEKLTIRDISITDTEQDALREANDRLREESPADPSPADAADAQHNTLAVEEAVMDIVRRGSIAALRAFMAQAPAVRGGTLSSDQLRQRKNLFIVTATLASRAAIRGGLDPDEALSMSDRFIRSCELLTSPDRITNLQYHMIVEFTERVERLRLHGRTDGLEAAVANYVQQHLSEPVTAEDLADALFVSRPYLSRRFREETGMTLTDYIRNAKTEEAKRLLRHSDKKAAAIGTYLGFSSPGHFSRVFKKVTGMTPQEYRGTAG